MPPGGSFIPPFGVWVYPPKGVVLSPHWVIGGGVIALLGWFCPRFSLILSPLGGGGGVTPLGAEGYGPSLC